MAKLRLMRQDAAAKGAQLDTLLSANRARLEAMLGCRGRGESQHLQPAVGSSSEGNGPTTTNVSQLLLLRQKVFDNTADPSTWFR